MAGGLRLRPYCDFPSLLVFGASLKVTLSVCLGGISTQNSVHVDARFLFSKGEHGI